jgi:hypothetical protein
MLSTDGSDATRSPSQGMPASVYCLVNGGVGNGRYQRQSCDNRWEHERPQTQDRRCHVKQLLRQSSLRPSQQRSSKVQLDAYLHS